MATLPTETQLQTVWSNLVAKLQSSKTHGTAYVALDNTLSDSLYPDHNLAEAAAMAQTRASLASMLSVGTVQAQHAPLLRTYGRVIVPSAPDTDLGSIFQKVYQYMVDTSKTVQSRGFTYASPAAGGSNVGVGNVRRLTVDPNGFNIEACCAEAKTIKCVQDEHSGAPKYQETFSLLGSALLKDDLENTNSGWNGTASALSGQASQQFISNPSFDNVDSDTTPTSLTGWTVSSYANMTVGRTASDYYRDFSGAPNPGGLIVGAGTRTVAQALSLRNVQINPLVPYWFQVAVQRRSSATGTVRMTVGGQYAEVDLATLTNNVWSILKIGPTTANWYQNWKADDATITFTFTTIATGTVVIDDFIFAPFTQFDGTWVAIVGGPTPYLRDDKYTFTDTDGGTGKIQYFVYRAFGRWFPSTGATPTWADPS